MRDEAGGDPVSGVRWTHRSLRGLCRALRHRGHRASAPVLGRLLRARGFALRVNRKRLARAQGPERDGQFRRLRRARATYLRRGEPAVSVDTKKRELVGPFRQPGRAWRRAPVDVSMYDFRSDALGVAIPYGVYDVGRDEGFVNVGTSHDTPAFAVAGLEAWWRRVGRRQYPRARRLLIEADGGGSNGNARRLWHVGLQGFADRTGLVVRVAHYPTGASKWNPIEHRLFSQISRSWAGRPLDRYETVLKTVRATRTTTGLRCRARLDRRTYLTGLEPTADERARLRLRRPKTLAAWNYVITPNRRPLGQLISLQPLSCRTCIP
jgi:hypothetical protein